MRILLISHSSPLKEGGAETRTREVAFSLARLGHDVTILCGKTQVSDPDVSNVNSVQIISKKTLPAVLLRKYPYPHYVSLAAANLSLMFYIPAFLKREKFDFIREDMCPFPPSFLLSLVRLPVARRIVIVHMLARTLRGWIKYYGAVFGFVGFIMDRLLRAGLLKYDQIVSDSKWLADELMEYPGISSRIRFVPNGANLADFNPCERRHRQNGNVRLLSVGRLVENKGHRYVIEALSRLKDEYPGVRLDILGKGPLKGPLIKLASELAVADRVKFLAPISHQQMPALLNEYDFFVLPSIWEGLPVSLIETMATKVPIVSTDIPAVTAIVDSNSATLASKEDAADLADKLRWALRHPEEVRARAERAYEIAQMYDWTTTASREIEDLD